MAKNTKRKSVLISKATRQFTDRNTLKEAYSKALKEIIEKETYVLNFYGFGGIGKTRLMKELQHINKDSRIVNIELDFKLKSNIEMFQALINLREAFKKNLEIKFTYFDLAYVDYLEKSSPQLVIKQKDLPFIEQGDLLCNLISGLNVVPLIGSVGSAIKLGNKAYKEFEKQMNKEIKSHILELSERSASEVLQDLPHYFAQDVMAYQQQHDDSQIVVFFDTYEALWDNKLVKDNFDEPDKWIQDILIPEMHNVLFVILGRDKLKWIQNDPDWEYYLDQHFLCELSYEDAAQFLCSCRIEDPQIQERIIKISKGYPLALDLCVDSYELISESRVPEVDDFGLSLDLNDLISRIIGHLSQSERELVLLLAHVKYWDREILNEIMRSFHIGLSIIQSHFLNDLSFVQYDPMLKMYKMHDVACEFLVGKIDMTIRNMLFRTMKSYYEIKISAMDITHANYVFVLNEVIRFAIDLNDDENTSNDYLLKVDLIEGCGRGDFLKGLLTKLYQNSVTQKVYVGVILSNIYFNEGNYMYALDLLTNLPSDSGKGLEIRRLSLIGRNYHRLYDWENAELHYKKVEELVQSSETNLDIQTQKNVLENGIRYSKLLLQQHQFTFAQQIQNNTYNRIITYNKLSDGHLIFEIEKARLLEKMCELQTCCADYGKALEYGHEAISIYSSLIATSEKSIKSVRLFQDQGLLYKRLAEAFVKQSNYQEAIKYYMDALNCYDEALKISETDIETYRRRGFAARGLFRQICLKDGYNAAVHYESIAIDSFEKAFLLNQYDASVVSAIGGVLTIKADTQQSTDPDLAEASILKAIEYYLNAIELNKHYIYAYGGLVESYCKLSKLRKSNSDIDKWVDMAKLKVSELRSICNDLQYIHAMECFINDLSLC